MAVVLLWTIVLLVRCCYASHSHLRVSVDGTDGKDSNACLTNEDKPCQSLSFISENLKEKNFVEIEILSDVLNLTKPVNFTHYHNLNIISGSTSSTRVCCNTSDAGLAFVRVTKLSIVSLSVEKCGAKRASTNVVDHRTPNKTLNLYVAVYILNCSDVSLQSVNILSSPGRGLSMYDTNGTVDIVDCEFTNNNLSSSEGESGGGGVYIEFTICTPGLVENCGSHGDRNTHSIYSIQNCSFTNNSAYSPRNTYNFTSVSRLGIGGGLYVSIGSDAKGNNFTIEDCAFVNNTASYFAGGAFVEYINSAKQNTISVVDTAFERNGCMQTQFSGGGGLVVVSMHYEKQSTHKENVFSCDRCVFRNNSGYMGGGTAIFATKDPAPALLSNISFHNCTWRENKSTMGAALFISPGIWHYTKEGFLPVPRFTQCTFESNSAVQKLHRPMTEGHGVIVESVGYAAVFVSELRVKFEGYSYFGNNLGSAVHLSSSVMQFKAESNVTFFNNTSHNGGAITMYGSSAIEIDNNSQFVFMNNNAYSRGGAIYSDSNAPACPAYHNCFIISRHFLKVNSTFVFRNNSAKASGSSIYTTTFQSCALLCGSENMPEDPTEVMQCIANFTFDDGNTTNNSSLSTRPRNFNLTGASPVDVIPGIEYLLNLSVSDEANNTLENLVYEATVTNNANVSLDPAFMQVSHNSIKLRGNSGSKAVMHLITSDVMVSFNVTLKDCKPGYQYNHSMKMCHCGALQYLGVEGCVYLKQGFWMGRCSRNSSKLCTAICSYGFCSYHGLKKDIGLLVLPNDTQSLAPAICTKHREGRFCGKCSVGYGVYHNSWELTCGPQKLCHLGWLFYILTDIIPVTILFVVVLVLNISFTTGNANTFVLYGQIIGLFSLTGNDGIYFPEPIVVLQTAVTLVYNSFNMNFFALEPLSYCLLNGTSFMGAMMMKYMTVLFALALVLITIFATRFKYVHRKLFFKLPHRHSVLIHGLSAFFILCYSQSARITFHLLTYSCLYSVKVKCEVYVVTYAGHLEFLTGAHIPYAAVAFLVLFVMIIMPPLLLLAYPLVFKLLGLCKLSETKLSLILWRVMPIQFLDAFQSSFKDRYRFFAGLYFLYRAAILALYVCTQSWMDFYSMVQLLLIFILTLHSLVQPHKEMKHNIIDSLLFANLCLINAISLYFYSTTYKGPSRSRISSAIFQAVLIIWPLLLVIVLRLIKWKRSRKRRRYEELPSLRGDEKCSLINS